MELSATETVKKEEREIILEKVTIPDQISEIMTALDFFDGVYEREAVDKAVALREEAIEICKLRLFLKLVAQIEGAEHMEPLPDIDMNYPVACCRVVH